MLLVFHAMLSYTQGRYMKLVYNEMDSIVGKLKLIGTNYSLLAVLWEKEKLNRVKISSSLREENHSLLKAAEKQLIEYFEGRRKFFDIPMELHGSEFQKLVWEALREIPYGVMVSYGELAKKIGKPTAARAVGAAIGKNPLSILIPCHRVIGLNNKLTGFAGGLNTKEILLNLEKQCSKKG